MRLTITLKQHPMADQNKRLQLQASIKNWHPGTLTASLMRVTTEPEFAETSAWLARAVFDTEPRVDTDPVQHTIAELAQTAEQLIEQANATGDPAVYQRAQQAIQLITAYETGDITEWRKPELETLYQTFWNRVQPLMREPVCYAAQAYAYRRDEQQVQRWVPVYLVYMPEAEDLTIAEYKNDEVHRWIPELNCQYNAAEDTLIAQMELDESKLYTRRVFK